MNYTYEEVISNLGKVIKRTDEDGVITIIPTDLGNSDYQAYLASLDEASTL
jgi:hypothetical protein